jgi:type III pantothenate kinase
MLLAIDIGNSTAKFGVFDNEKLITRFTLPTDRYPPEINDLTANNLTGLIDAVIVSSVVPQLNSAYEKFCEAHFGLAPLFVDHALDFGLKILYDPPTSLGVDRAVAAFSAREKYGAPVIVCDFGTATTIDVVNEKGEFIGGIIAPGISTLADILFHKTSNLPHVEITKPEKVIGSSTVSAIHAGIYFGYAGLVENILQKMIGELGETPRMIATGGFAAFIAESVEMIELVDENLVLEGLRLIYEKVSTRSDSEG